MNKHTHSIDDMPPPKWFWIVSSILLVWNLMGVMAFFQQMAVTAEQIAAMPEAEQLLYNSIPIWATIAFAFAVFGGTLGCVGLLMRKTIAKYILLLSLIGVLVQMFHSLFVINSIAVYGPGAAVMPFMVIIVAIYLVFLANQAQSKGWLK
jgi:hypothetical protein